MMQGAAENDRVNEIQDIYRFLASELWRLRKVGLRPRERQAGTEMIGQFRKHAETGEIPSLASAKLALSILVRAEASKLYPQGQMDQLFTLFDWMFSDSRTLPHPKMIQGDVAIEGLELEDDEMFNLSSVRVLCSSCNRWSEVMLVHDLRTTAIDLCYTAMRITADHCCGDADRVVVAPPKTHRRPASEREQLSFAWEMLEALDRRLKSSNEASCYRSINPCRVFLKEIREAMGATS